MNRLSFALFLAFYFAFFSAEAQTRTRILQFEIVDSTKWILISDTVVSGDQRIPSLEAMRRSDGYRAKLLNSNGGPITTFYIPNPYEDTSGNPIPTKQPMRYEIRFSHLIKATAVEIRLDAPLVSTVLHTVPLKRIE